MNCKPWLGAALLLLAACVQAQTAAVFDAGNLSGPADDADPAFAPDGNSLVFSRNGTLLLAHREGKGWSRPAIAPFSGVWNDQQPAMAPDGAYLVFVSNRPAAAGGAALAGGNLWRVDRHGENWGEPVRLPDTVNRGTSIWAPSLARSGNLYFIMRGAAGQPFRIWCAHRSGADYLPPQPVLLGDPVSQDVDPAVAPDESFIVFASRRAGARNERLYIALRSGAGWGDPRDLGDAVNGDGSADVNEPRLGPDARTLYFSTDRQLPVRYPRDLATAARDLDRAQVWDNGRQNIWSVALAPWLPGVVR